MKSEMIGIAGVFVLTFFLFALRHFILTIGRANNSGHDTRPAPSRNHELNKESGEDDAWLLWTPEPDQSDSSNRLNDELAERRTHAERKGSSPLR